MSEIGAKLSKFFEIWKLYLKYVLIITLCDTKNNNLEIITVR